MATANGLRKGESVLVTMPNEEPTELNDPLERVKAALFYLSKKRGAMIEHRFMAIAVIEWVPPDSPIDTLAVSLAGDDIVRLHMNKQFIMDNTVETIGFGLDHEMWHLILGQLRTGVTRDQIRMTAEELVVNARVMAHLKVALPELGRHSEPNARPCGNCADCSKGQPCHAGGALCDPDEYYKAYKKAFPDTNVTRDQFLITDVTCAEYLRQLAEASQTCTNCGGQVQQKSKGRKSKKDQGSTQSNPQSGQQGQPQTGQGQDSQDQSGQDSQGQGQGSGDSDSQDGSDGQGQGQPQAGQGQDGSDGQGQGQSQTGQGQGQGQASMPGAGNFPCQCGQKHGQGIPQTGAGKGGQACAHGNGTLLPEEDDGTSGGMVQADKLDQKLGDIIGDLYKRAMEGNEEARETLEDLAKSAPNLPAWGDYPLGALRGEPVSSRNTSFWEQLLASELASYLVPGERPAYNRKIGWFVESLLPCGKEPETTAVCYYDTSGSMDERVIQTVSQMTGSFPGCQRKEFAFDHAIYEVKPGQHLQGGGGTSFDLVEEHVKTLEEEPDVIVVVTDGYAPVIVPENRDKWIWVFVGPCEMWPEDVGMRCIRVDW